MPKRVYRMDVPRTDFNATHIPSTDEIKRECEKIQKSWSRRERELRTASAFRKVSARLVEGFANQQGHRVFRMEFSD